MKYFCFCQGDLLLTPDYAIPEDVKVLNLKPWQMVTCLKVGVEECQVVRLDAPICDEHFVMMSLRKSYEVLTHEDYRLAGKASELLYWDANSRYCGCCGAPMRWDTEISKKCTQCKKELWPQLQPAIIVRIVKKVNDNPADDEILMVHAHNFRGTHYGLVAGFVETGETLEDCVRREVKEEVGIEIADVRYFGSQSWPYPASLMVGFTARYVGGEVCLQRSELASGGWFRRDNMPEFPGAVSIAGQLVADWLKGRCEGDSAPPR